MADYGRGLTATPTFEPRWIGRRRRVPVIWDPHPAGAAPVPGVDVVTPNLAEARGLLAARPGWRLAACAAPTTRGRWPGHSAGEWRSQAVLVTLGRARGGARCWPGRPVTASLPAPRRRRRSLRRRRQARRQPGVHLLEGRDLEDAAVLAVREAAAFLAPRGRGTRCRRRTGRPGPEAAAPARDAAALARRVQARGGTVVATGGCFDLLHAGHARSLAAARNWATA